MAKAEKTESEFQGGYFYKTEDQLLDEIRRFLGTRRKNAGATEWQITHVVNSRPFVSGLQEAKEDSEHKYFPSKKAEINFLTGMRRCAVFPVVKKLLNEGYKVAEIADALTLPYSTVYYYAKKIKNHKRLREDRTMWHIDDATNCIAPMKLPRDKAAAFARKEIMRKAAEKRARKGAKLAAIAANRQEKQAKANG